MTGNVVGEVTVMGMARANHHRGAIIRMMKTMMRKIITMRIMMTRTRIKTEMSEAREAGIVARNKIMMKIMMRRTTMIMKKIREEEVVTETQDREAISARKTMMMKIMTKKIMMRKMMMKMTIGEEAAGARASKAGVHAEDLEE